MQGCGLAGITETWWDGSRTDGSTGDTSTCICSRPPEHRDEAFYRQLQVASSLQAPVLKGDFTKLGIFWMTNTAQHKQPRRFLESTNDNLLTKKKDKELDFLLTNKA